jgi:seryl-tRNA synthetase
VANDEVKAAPFKFQSEALEANWSLMMNNQVTMIAQQGELLEMHRKAIAALEKVASPERVKGVEEGQRKMVEAVNNLSVKMETANSQLELAVTKLASAFWGLMKVPVAVVVVGVASWAFLFMHKIEETTWLIMLGVAVFPWLGDSVTAITKLISGRNIGNNNK